MHKCLKRLNILINKTFFFLPKNDLGNEKVTNTQIQDCQLKKAHLSLPLQQKPFKTDQCECQHPNVLI